MANWFYVAGSLCFLIGTIINMLPSKGIPLTTDMFEQYRVPTPEESARNWIPLASPIQRSSMPSTPRIRCSSTEVPGATNKFGGRFA